MDPEVSWRQVPNWSDIDWHQYSLVSFDIFDTLLHRTVVTPKSLFLELGAKAVELGLVDSSLSPAEFAQLRVDMEKEARRKSSGRSTEVTLEQIWQQAPKGMPIAKLMSLELDIESTHSFVNPYTVDLLSYLQDADIRLCLTSDTYFPREYIERLLAKANIDCNKLTVLLSCEQDANKTTGDLFQKMLDREALEPDQILHLGDDLTADYLQAQKAGVAVCYLGDIHLPAELNQGEMLLGIDSMQDPLRSLRRLGHFVSPANNNKDAFFRYLGASALGPGLCAFVLWAVKDAKARGIELICPIMREGALLDPLLQNACKLIGVDIKVKPLYTSRRAAFLPSMTELDDNALKQYASRRHFTLSDLIEELGLPEIPEILRDQLDQPLNEISKQNQLKEYLWSTPVQTAARRSSEEARMLLTEYVATLWQGYVKVALMDLGPGGNSLAWIADSIGSLSECIDINYLFYSIPELTKHRRRGHHYAVFLPHSLEVLPLLRLFNRSPEPIEILLTGRHQTTLGYQRDRSGDVIPVLADVFQDPAQDRLLVEFTAGVQRAWQHFAHVYYQTGGDNLTGREVSTVLLKQIQRLLELPTPLEARLLGDLKFDDNAGSLSYGRICSDDDAVRLKDWGPEEFIRRARQLWGYQTYNIRWPQAVVSRAYPDFLASKHRALFNDVEHKLLCVTLLEQLKEDGHNLVTLYGGGKLGYEMLQEALDRGIEVDYIVDSNAALHGCRLLNREIVSLQKAVSVGSGIYLVASAAFALPIEEGIQHYYGELGLEYPPIYAIHRRKF